MGNWSECSAGCGQGGLQYRAVSCEQRVSADVHAVVDDQLCARALGARPADRQECNTDPAECPTYHVGDWSPVSPDSRVHDPSRPDLTHSPDLARVQSHTL